MASNLTRSVKFTTMFSSKIPLQAFQNYQRRLVFRGKLRPFMGRLLATTTKSSLLDYVQDVEKSSEFEASSLYTKSALKERLSSLLQNKRPGLLGLDVTRLQERVEFLESVGMNGEDALTVALEIPSYLEFRNESLKAISELLVGIGCNLSKILIKAPYICGIDISVIESNVKRLEGAVGVSNRIVARAIETKPLLAVFPISDKAIEVIKVLTSSWAFDEGINNCYNPEVKLIRHCDFALRLLLQPFDGAREQAILGDNFEKLAQFLRELQISPCLTALNNPSFFSADVNRLYQAVEFFSGRPLLFEIELIQKILVTKPEVLINFNREEEGEAVELVQGIAKTPRNLYVLLKRYYFSADHQVADLANVIRILQKYQFKAEQIETLLANHFFGPDKGNLERKLQVLLSIEGLDVDLIAENSNCLMKPLSFLENRVAFAREAKKELLETCNMESLFLSGDEYFVTVICQSSVEKYKELTGDNIILGNPKDSGPYRKPKRKKAQKN